MAETDKIVGKDRLASDYIVVDTNLELRLYGFQVSRLGLCLDLIDVAERMHVFITVVDVSCKNVLLDKIRES